MHKSSVHHSARPGRAFIFFMIVLSGLAIYTPSAKAQLSGTYSICASSCNYSSFSAAYSDLATKGVSGPVVFNVSAATYTEYLSISPITGASATNTITFKGAGRSKTILTGSSGSNILYISASYLIFDGLTIKNTNSTGSPVYLYNANNCSFLNSNITGVSSGNAAVYAYNTNYLTINNCYLYGGNYTVYFYGSNSTSSAPVGNFTFSKNRVTGYGSAAVYAQNAGGYGAVNNIYSNNVIDSAANGSGYGFRSQYESGAVYQGNKIYAANSYGMLMYYPNYYSSANPYNIVNNWITNYSSYALYLYLQTGGGNTLLAHNTFYTDSSIKAGGAIYIYNLLTNKALSIKNNIFEMLSGSSATVGLFGNVSGFNTIDGNDVVAPGQAVGSVFSTSCSDFASYQKAMSAYGWETNASSIKPMYNSPPYNLHLNQAKTAPFGPYAGIDLDIDGDTRCKLFPTSGADESSYGKGTPSVKIYLPSQIYPNSPTLVFQSAKAGEPKIHHWYLNGVKVSDSVVLSTSAFKAGLNTLKLVTISCGGTDSATVIDTVKSPSSVPVVDFIASTNKVIAGGTISFHDLSTNGPTSWLWEITPLFSYASGSQQPAFTYVYGSSTTVYNEIRFNAPGKYKVCLTASNGVGKGTQLCKVDYITVYPAYNLGSASTIKDTLGYLYDNGGPNANYSQAPSANKYIQSVVIDPCADSVFLTFSYFDTYCGYDYVRIYSGRDRTGTPLWPSKCSASSGFGGYGPGFTGGKAYSCTYTCMPNTIKPDTFK